MKAVYRWTALALLAAGISGGCRTSAPADEPQAGYTRLNGAELFSARYDADASSLTVVTRGGEAWRYRNVPAAAAEALIAAPDPDACWRETLDGKFERTNY